MSKNTVLCAITLVAACACASPETSVQPAREQGEMVTGSRIPRKPGTSPVDRIRTVDPEELRQLDRGAAADNPIPK